VYLFLTSVCSPIGALASSTNRMPRESRRHPGLTEIFLRLTDVFGYDLAQVDAMYIQSKVAADHPGTTFFRFRSQPEIESWLNGKPSVAAQPANANPGA